ncbi:MAG: site-specific integrase [Methylomonas sp.]|nr:site-specific integrase [Methylomonas sp.]PPD50540.1 MAG: hypothetical protein CTY13_01600 [Methylobacter sp.]PPD53541.1 MAG: hypothetical protein CTY12_04795 [Methylotenera sp.]
MLTPQDRLFKRADIYYYRRRVPANLRPFFKSPVFVISLKTPQLCNAKRLANCYDLHFDFLNNKAIMDKIDPTKVRKMTVTADSTGSIKYEVSPDDMREMTNMSPDQIAAMISSFSQGIGYKPTQLDTPVKASVELPSPAKAYPTLESLIEQFFAFKKSKKASYVPPKNHLTFLRRLQEILVDVSTIDEITATHVNTVIDKLRKLPVASIRYPNMTVEEIISKVKQDEERLADKTINNHIELYAQVFDYYESYHDKNYINYFAGMRQQADIKDKVKSNELRSSFTRDDLTTIFSSPRFAQRRYVKNYQYWTPLIALFTGARRAEIASLYREDIYQDKRGIWVMDINLNHEDKRVKTVNSVRVTPLHPWLLNHGFLDFVKSIHHPRIFPELKTIDEDEGYGRNLGENFNGFIHTKLNIEEDKVFHSFRHTFASELSRQGVNDSIIEQLSGREDAGSTTGRKFYIDSADTPTLLTYINKLDFTEELKLVQWKK